MSEIFKVTIERGREAEFELYCREHGITHKQYPGVITWAFRVELPAGASNVVMMMQERDFVRSIEPMPIVSLS